MRETVRDDGTNYYEYLLFYKNNCIAIGLNPEEIRRDEIRKYFKLKESSIGPLGQYIGGKVWKILLKNGIKCWVFGSSQYIQKDVKNLKKYLSERNKTLAKKVKVLLMRGYHPEVDLSVEPNPEDSAYYKSLIGVLHWIVELRRVDICCKVSMLLSCLVLPREGHLQSLFHIFSYLGAKHNA